MNIISKLNVLSLMLFVLVMQGCATGYRPKGMFGGYEDKLVGENLYEVRFYRNQHTSADRTQKFLLYRCAEVALENNFDSFIIITDQSYLKETVTEPEIEISQDDDIHVRSVVSSSKSDWSQATVTFNWTGIYLIALV